MASLGETREDNECSICQELFTEPKILPCAHLVCRDCLVDWLQTKGDAKCPICRAVITNTTDRSLENCKACVDSLPTDLAMAAVTDSMRLLSEQRFCGMCNVAEGEFFCVSCRVTLCQACVQLHGRLPSCHSHKVEALSSLTSKNLAANQRVPCSVHADKTSELFCCTHDKVICHSCFATDHRSCPDIIDLEKMLERSRNRISELEKCLISSEADLNKAIEGFDEILTQSEKTTKKAIQDIDDKCNKILLSVENCRQRLKSTVLAAEIKTKTAVHDGKTPLQMKRGTVVAHRLLIERIQKTIPNTLLHPMASTLDVRIKSLGLEAVLPEKSEPITLATLTMDPQVQGRLELELEKFGTLAEYPAILKHQLRSVAGCTLDTRVFPENVCRILLLGKVGAGKSSTGNSILGLKPARPNDPDTSKKGFDVGRGNFTLQPRHWEMKMVMRGDLRICVTDSPALENTARKPEEIYQDIATTLTFVNPGPHVLLLVYKFERFTEKDFKIYTDFKQLLGDNIKKYIIVIFTFVENLVDDDDEEEDLYEALKKEIMENSPENLLSLLKETGMRYFPFTNKAKGDRMKKQVDQLFQMIFQLVSANKGSYFQSPYTESINKQLKEMIAEKIMSPEDREAKRKEEELQNKKKELEMAKQRELEAKDRADLEDMEKQLAQLNQTMLNLELQQRNRENDVMRSLLEEIRQGRHNPSHINLTQEPCTVM